MRKIDRYAHAIPVVLVAVVAALNLLPFFQTADLRLYDQLLRLKGSVEEDDRFLILRVDDAAIAAVGGWPWSRDIIANGMWTLKELGADRLVFDIEYMDRSPSGVDRTLLEERIPAAISSQFGAVVRNSTDLLQAIAEGRIPAEDAMDFSELLRRSAEQSELTLTERVAEIARDNDAYMGRAAEVFENAFYTVTLLPEPGQIAPTTPDDLAFAVERYPLRDAPNDHGLVRVSSIQPVIRSIGSRGAGAGFTNVVVDTDGVRRRVNLLADYDGRLFGQLAFVPLWDLLGRPEIEITGRRVVLRDAQLPDSETPTDIRIPLSHDYRLLINWPRKSFNDSFRQISYAQILRHTDLLDSLRQNLELMRDAGYFRFFDGTPPTDLIQYAEELRREVMLEERSADWFDQYAEIMQAFVGETDTLLNGETEDSLISYIEEFRAGTDSDDERAEYEAIIEDAKDVFDSTRGIFESLAALREELANQLEDAFVIIGQTGVGTVDIGVNPFEGEYFNVGTHAALANTILQRDFLLEEPRWISVTLAVVLGLGIGLGTARLDTKKGILFGILSLVIVAAGGAAYFLLTSRYLPLLTPITAVAVAFVATSTTSSLRNSAERAFLRNAFSRYLSADVIGQILDDPDRLALGGDKKFLSAMFTDIQGFSTISEKLDPSDLVRLLNEYLTAMSDIILDVRGTIDKYEGDAIIAFFGAPLDDPEHAANACRSAIRMKRVEVELNERFLAGQMTPSPLSTRIGINTGDMVVGNMGTERKMDYTIMGHAVNLAARLEGVNKQYGSYILVSESTRHWAGDGFLFRRLDRVRVVGVSEPVQLYELLDERSAASSEMIARVEQFEQAIDLFQSRRFSEANRLFADLARLEGDAGSAATYRARCAEYEKSPPTESWDGVYKLTQK